MTPVKFGRIIQEALLFDTVWYNPQLDLIYVSAPLHRLFRDHVIDAVTSVLLLRIATAIYLGPL